jgi:hypothetical protein
MVRFTPMLSMSQVQQMLSGGLHDVIVDAHKGGFKRYADVADEFPAVVAAFNQRERANFLHSQIRQLVEVGVESRDDAQVTSWDIDTLAVGVNLLVRFKYLGNGAPANNKSTEQQKLLDRQMYTEETMALLARAGIMDAPHHGHCRVHGRRPRPRPRHHPARLQGPRAVELRHLGRHRCDRAAQA